MWQSFNQKRLELWMFEGTWQLNQKAQKVGEIRMGADGKGLVTGGTTRKSDHQCEIMGKGTPEDPYTLTDWQLSSWDFNKRFWKFMKGSKAQQGSKDVTWTLMSQPPSCAASKFQKNLFWKELKKDSRADRDRALAIAEAPATFELDKHLPLEQGLPIHLFSRQEAMAWRWEGINKPLKKDQFDVDCWHDTLGLGR